MPSSNFLVVLRHVIRLAEHAEPTRVELEICSSRTRRVLTRVRLEQLADSPNTKKEYELIA